MNRKDELLERKAALESELGAVNAELANVGGRPTLTIEGDIGDVIEYLLDNETVHERIAELEAFKKEFDAIQAELHAALEALKTDNSDRARHRYHVANANCMELFWNHKP